MSSPLIYNMLNFPNFTRKILLNLHNIALVSYQTNLEATIASGKSDIPVSALESQLQLVKEARARRLLGIPPEVIIARRDILKITFEG